jgi:hypothetical protein
MPISEYILLALLGTGGVALPGGDATVAPRTTLGADAIMQPNGGALSSLYTGQNPPKKEDSRRFRKTQHGRHHNKVHRHTVKQPRTPKKDG